MLAVLLAGICGISAFTQNEFSYTKNVQTDKCDVCYYLQCYPMDKARCTYYSLTSDIAENNTHEYESPSEITDEVDEMIFKYTEKASNVAVYKDCIPFISQYTNCNRDNICHGCKTCNCDSEGRWNCSSIQHCRPHHETPLNHHSLVIVLENLNDYKNAITNIRSKRSVMKEKEIMSAQEVLNWMYGMQTFDSDKDFPNTTAEANSNSTNRCNENSNSILSSWTNQNDKQDFNETESQPLVFEDLLNDLNINNDKVHSSLEDTIFRSKNINELEQPKAANEITNSLLTDTTILDENYQTNKNDTDGIFENVLEFIDSDINDNFNFKRDVTYNARRLDKRDVGLQTINVTSISDNNTNKVNEVQSILFPLHNIVLQKQEELSKLIDIRDKLITFLKPFTDININTNFTNATYENITNLYLIQLNSIQDSDNFRKLDQNMPNKYLQKFKRDIHEVVRDIAGIQRFSNYSAIPYDLKILIRAMRNYLKKENDRKKISSFPNNNTIDLRKKIDTIDNSNKKDIKPIDEIINIFEVLDHDLPSYNVLNLLAPETRKIIRRIMKTFYKSNMNIDSHINTTYDFTKSLENIGKNWNDMTIDIATNSISERLYSMRLFYLVLSLDIEKMNGALALLEFAENRRMIIDDIKGETTVERIANDLKQSNRRFNHVIQIQTIRSRVNNTARGNQLSKKKSILQHIKTLLKNSKLDIRKLLHRKVPKSQIVKHIAKKKINEIRKNKLAEYEETMQRWQNNLNIISRNKRAAGFFDNFINNIKNLFSGRRRSYNKKADKTEKVKKHVQKSGPKKTKKYIATTKKTTITTYKQK